MNDLTADLLVDLQRPAPLPSSPVLRPLPELPAAAGTPAVAVTLTPLRWSRPAFVAPAPVSGHGVAVRLGPWQVEVAF